MHCTTFRDVAPLFALETAAAEKVSLYQMCPGLNANEIQIPHVKHHKVSSLVKSHQNTHNAVKHNVI